MACTIRCLLFCLIEQAAEEEEFLVGLGGSRMLLWGVVKSLADPPPKYPPSEMCRDQANRVPLASCLTDADAIPADPSTTPSEMDSKNEHTKKKRAATG